MSAKIVIVNGSGRTGKDTFCEMCGQDAACVVFSSVSCVKDLAAQVGWNGKKTEKDRKFLSDLKDLLTAYNDFPMRSMVDFVMTNGNQYEIIFLMIREPEEIERAVKEFDAITVLVKRNQAEAITSNHADRDVELYDYDFTVYNYGSLYELQSTASSFVALLRSGWFDAKQQGDRAGSKIYSGGESCL